MFASVKRIEGFPLLGSKSALNQGADGTTVIEGQRYNFSGREIRRVRKSLNVAVREASYRDIGPLGSKTGETEARTSLVLRSWRC